MSAETQRPGASDTPTIRCLHLSDLRLQATEPWAERPQLAALIRHAEALVDGGLGPDLVCITGDVADGGQQADYDEAERFLTALAGALGLDPGRSFFLVPGDCDVDPAAIRPVEGFVASGLTEGGAVDQALEDPRTMTLLARRLEAFYSFTTRLLGAERGLRPERPWGGEVIDVGGHTVGVLQLNTAWCCEGAEMSQPRVGTAQLRSTLAATAEADLRFALLHHPFEVLEDDDRSAVESLLTKPDAPHVWLHGPPATAALPATLSGDAQPRLMLTAGPAWAAPARPAGHLLAVLEPDHGAAHLHLFRYSPAGRGFYARDTLAAEEAPDGVWTHDLPRLKIARKTATTTAATQAATSPDATPDAPPPGAPASDEAALTTDATPKMDATPNRPARASILAHPTLSTHLAASSLGQSAAPEEEIADHLDDPEGRDICLRVIVDRADDKAFLDRLYDRLTAHPSTASWTFLLHCLGAEAAFDARQRSTILEAIAAARLDGAMGEPVDLDALIANCKRHGPWIEHWLAGRFATARGEALLGLTALRLEAPQRLISTLGQRSDAADAAADLLDLWPATEVGAWAAEAVTAETAAVWGRATAPELLIARSLAALTARPGARLLRPPLLLALVRTAARTVTAGHTAIAQLAAAPRPGGQGLPPRVRAEPGTFSLTTAPAWPRMPPSGGDSLATAYAARPIARAGARDNAMDFAHYTAQYFHRFVPLAQPRDFTRYLARGFPRGFLAAADAQLEADFASELAHFFDFEFDWTVAATFAPLFALGTAADFVQDFDRRFSLSFIRIKTPKRRATETDEDVKENRGPMPTPTHAEVPADVAARGIAMMSREGPDAELYVTLTYTRLVAEAWVALMTTVNAPADARLAYLHRRVENAWLAHVWSAVDGRLAEQTDPEAHALYLALGWTQATTSGTWPATERWIGRLGSTPPAHWLPRTQWHLAWLLADPTDTTHHHGFEAALAEGNAEATSRPLATALEAALDGR